jgi:hypothetical protein
MYMHTHALFPVRVQTAVAAPGFAQDRMTARIAKPIPRTLACVILVCAMITTRARLRGAFPRWTHRIHAFRSCCWRVVF